MYSALVGRTTTGSNKISDHSTESTLVKLLRQSSVVESRRRRTATAGRMSESTSKQDADDADNEEEDFDEEFLNVDDQPLLHGDRELPNKRSARWYRLWDDLYFFSAIFTTLHSFIDSLIHSYIHSFIHSFITITQKP